MITQTQIEAYIKRLRAGLAEIVNHRIDSELASKEKRAMAYRTLGDGPIEAITAAAEVGEPKEPKMSKWDARYSGSAKEIEDHTIERCAQVAENYLDKDHIVPAAIRALKNS